MPTEEEKKKDKEITARNASFIKIRKMLKTAFDPRGDVEETDAAFRMARTMMSKAKIVIEEIIRPEWGGGPLMVALQRVGSTVLPVGTYEGRTISYVMEVDPDYIINMSNSGGFRNPVVTADMATVTKAYAEQVMCMLAGDYEE